MDNFLRGKIIDKLRFRLFEIGFQISEEQAIFYIAKAWQLLQKKSSLDIQRVSNSRQLSASPLSNYATEENKILKLALSLAHTNLLPKLKNQSLAELTNIQREQLTIPTTAQLLEIDKNIPFSLREFLQYSSHFNGRVSMLWYAIHINQLSFVSPNYITMLENMFPTEILIWRSQLQLMGKYNLKEYLPLIVHPWQLKHLVNTQLKTLIHEKLLLGPLNLQKMYSCFDANYLMTSESNTCLYHTNLYKTSPINHEDRSQIENLLKKHTHIQSSFGCLFNQTVLKLNYNQVKLNSSFCDQTSILPQNGDHLISINSLINTNLAYSKPLLIKLFCHKKENFMLFFQSLLIKYMEIAQVFSKELNLTCSNEHILIALKGTEVLKVFYRNPATLTFNRNSKFIFENDLFRQILDCYFRHTGDTETVKTATQLIREWDLKMRS